MQIKRQQTGAGGGAETTAGVGFPQQCPLLGSEPLRGTKMDSPTRGAHWVQKRSRADQRVALLRRKKKKSQLNKHCMQTEKTLLGLLFPAQHLGQVQEQTVGDT